MWEALIQAGASLLGGALSQSNSQGMSKDDRRFQREVMQNQLQWRARDASLAGIHPAFAAGGNIATGSPTAVVGDDIGRGLAAAGQDLSRAMMANADRKQRAMAQQIALEASAREEERQGQRHVLEMQRLGLENTMLQSQIARLQANQVGPPAASLGQVDVIPSTTMTTTRGAPAEQAGQIAHHRYMRTPDGGYRISQSVEGKQINEDSLEGLEWSFANNLLPRLTGTPSSGPPADVPLRPNSHWAWNSFTNTWYMRSGRRRPSARTRYLERRFGVPLERR